MADMAKLNKVFGGLDLDFLLNVRVNAAPALLEQVVVQTVEAIQPDAGARYYFDHFECFSPLPPKPTHRL
jgi:hypothetical protein